MSLTCALPLPPPPKAMAMGMEVDFAEEEEEPLEEATASGGSAAGVKAALLAVGLCQGAQGVDAEVLGIRGC